MFESPGSNRLQHERKLWIERRKMGKKWFVFSYTLIIGNGFFCLFRIPILIHFWYGQTLSKHGRMVGAWVSLLLGVAAGLLFSLLLWRRGERLVSSTDETIP